MAPIKSCALVLERLSFSHTMYLIVKNLLYMGTPVVKPIFALCSKTSKKNFDMGSAGNGGSFTPHWTATVLSYPKI